MDLKQLISDHKAMVREMKDGERYYKSRNTFIMERKKEFYSITQGRRVEDFTKANFKLPSGFTKLIVDQKVNYLVNEHTTLDDKSKEVLGNKYKRTLKRVSKDASNKIYGVLQWYIENNELKYKKMYPEEIILVYSLEDTELLEYVIRYYKVGKLDKAEVWDDTDVKYYVKQEGEYKLIDTKAHIVNANVSNNQVFSETAVAWGRPPFSILWNNDEEVNDLNAFKFYVDMYDLISSDFGNNFDDYGEMYWILKNYNGQDAKSFIQEFKESRVLKVAGDGDAKAEAQEVPYMARETFLKLLKEDIYESGMAVDPKTISGDSTNLTIEALFYNLDLKASDFETQLQDFFEQCMYFVNVYNNNKGASEIDGEISFTRAKFINEKETVETLLMQRGLRSDRKLLEKMPGVTDIEEELRLMAEQNANEVTLIESNPFEE